MRASSGNGTSTSLNFAWIQLGGFRVGKDESAFETFSGYAGSTIADDLIPYGPFDTGLISYTFDAGNGFSAILSLEEGNNESYDDDGLGLPGFVGGLGGGDTAAGALAYGDDYRIDSYVPHIVGGLKYAGAWGGVNAVVGYDSIHEEVAAKIRADVNVNDQFSLFAMVGYGSYDDNVTSVDNSAGAIGGTAFGKNYYKPWNGNWAAWGGATYKASDKATLNLAVSWAQGYDELDADGDWGVAANVDYELVKGFHIIPEVTYSDYGWIDDGVLSSAAKDRAQGFGGMIRFERKF